MLQSRNQQTRAVKPDWMTSTGPYIGRIVNHLDPDYMGRIEVEILKTGSGANDVSSGFFIPCTYVSPFMGVTPRQGVSSNLGFDYTQKSYGLWAIPPDIGVKVLVLMEENNYSKGYWIGCIQDSFMNFMLPGNGSTTYNESDTSKMIPVGEYNKKTVRNKSGGKGNDPTQFPKPQNDDHVDILTTQGIQDDQIRGTNTSSARREVPSMVFGWSTPGPLDRRITNSSGAAVTKPKIKYGSSTGSLLVPFSRLGGSSFVMDDGDEKLLRKKPASTDPPEYAKVELGETDGDPSLLHNELIRLKTRTGHQILMHNTEDLIYIINAQGTAYIELTSNGKIDIYSKDSLSVHTENDINFKADRDFNFEALRNVNIKAHEELRIESGHMTNMRVGTLKKEGDSLFVETTKNTHIKTGTHADKGFLKIEASLDGHITTGTEFRLYAGTHIHQKSKNHTYHESGTNFYQKSNQNFYQQSLSNMNIRAGAHAKIYADVNAVIKGKNTFTTAMNSNHVKSRKNYVTAKSNHIVSSNNFLLGSNHMVGTNYLTGTNYAFGGNIGPTFMPPNPFIPVLGSKGEKGLNGATALRSTSSETALIPDPALDAYIPIRIPLHEPWKSHENLKPKDFVPAKTDSTTRELQIEQEYSAVIDTFRKGS